MSTNGSQIDNVIFKRNGVNQEERFSDALEPSNLKLHDFTIEDWLLFAYNFAKEVNFFDTNNDKKPEGNWQELFNYFGFSKDNLPNGNIPQRTDERYGYLKENITKTLSTANINQDLTPHLTLFVCFLKLLELSQNKLNGITKKHLDFFYKDILQIEKLPAKADKVSIIFELAKKVAEEKIDANTELDAGKDPDGKKLIYKTTEEFIANKAHIAYLKSVYNDINLGEIKCSEIANSLDGKGEPLKEDSPYWFPFGYTSKEEKYPKLDDAKLGFAIASELFNLKEGDRNIDITIDFDEVLTFHDLLDTNDLLNNISILYSGKKGWIGNIKLSTDLSFKNVSQYTSISSNQLKLVFKIPKDNPAIANYDQSVLGEFFSTELPVIRFLINTQDKKGHTLFRSLVTKPITNITAKVEVKDVKSLILESDTGALNAAKPFFPFTTQPEKNSSFIINYPEIFSKNWTDAYINIKWKNTPLSFVTHYAAYKNSFLETVSKQSFLDAIFPKESVKKMMSANQPEDGISKKNNSKIKAPIEINEEIEAVEETPETPEIDPNAGIVIENYFKATLSVLDKEVWDEQDETVNLFDADDEEDNAFESNIHVKGDYGPGKSGPIRLTLNQSFLHSLFPKIYTLAIMNVADEPTTPIPNEPYTPVVESISLDYSAEESIVFSEENIDFTLSAYESNRIKLFHEAPFGQQEEHSYLKQQAIKKEILDPSAPIASCLVPDYCNGGEFYVGFQDAEIMQQISLLFQILEGSENTSVDTFTGIQKVEWYILCNNYWKNLDKDILANGIDNFLKSGIVKFGIPKQATNDNTLFPANTIWIKAKMHKDYNAVCKVIDVKTQVVTAQFFDNNNNLAHLESTLPAKTISKLITRVPQIKSIEQPFNSFDGKPLESDPSYYLRVSERLRHKNRAITLWDYEHLILQEFPNAFRVKCLNHTFISGKDTSFLAPGKVTLVVIPDIVDKNVFDIYEPRVSTATLNSIESFINSKNSMLVSAKVINPDYEKVIVKLKVKFYPEYDENFYKKQLNEDLIKFLSPWAFDTSKQIIFGVELQRSVVIEYIENLYYVDFLSMLEMAIYIDKTNKEEPKTLEDTDKNDAKAYLLDFQTTLSPSSPKNILVSVKNHIISTDIDTCKKITPQEPEKCQY
ncbi:baseplate J/gp47 family protein [Flavobacterium sharifuzzamanii]|uniref:phage baseplate protein n=1 Tax=Flavobacterium sharifuzzamanii TaxID=2211133 RepID=UPI000DAEAE2A|nr:phage baseplate protein [Flavobacterium sharifuzzamanii]KAF2080759.1 phage baseplate protein [Flavobacterium sharifuzzamanii]